MASRYPKRAGRRIRGVIIVPRFHQDHPQLHLGYESVTPFPLKGLDVAEREGSVEPAGDPYEF